MALLMLIDLMILSMSSLLKLIADKLLSGLRKTNLGNELLLLVYILKEKNHRKA